MANIGDRFKTGQRVETTGTYEFDGYLDGTWTPAPTAEERRMRLEASRDTFPPIRSCNKGCYWKLVVVG